MINIIILKVFILTIFSAIIAFLITPSVSYFLYKHKFRKQLRSESDAPVYFQLHKSKEGTPTMGGIIIWLTVLLVIGLFYVISVIFPDTKISILNFFSRSQTLLPLGALIVSALFGLIDDYMGVKRIGPKGGGLSVKQKILIYFALSLCGALWFYFRLDWDVLHIPFIGNFNVGLWIIPIFVFVVSATSFSVNETDGLDGLVGGLLLVCFAALGVICFLQGKFDLCAFCAVIVGALVSFLWFNIPPARFFMGDTGSMSLGVTLGIIAMLTNTLLYLPIFAFIFLVESLSVIIQTIYKKTHCGKKLFISTPIHHHLEAIGWPESKIVMRAWLLSGILAVSTLIIYLFDKAI
ncbi:MAG TPA: phospho-N-acetylmuramoyl-pentapeptide-transferase [bacterium]|jgi:phospho-N-acetylmuramoyl-pentapeptide-transferase|nr:phospho-N-acetylmuramoyl-pentapeptide-transferase [bacterium]HOG38214.1 phospho-N-acetylmuramoyl-pentapeptide-transferase [bacterium]HQI03196.1 phospho-N-acetylmuramoyl-pentapeptide-transferase [bacterium]